MAVLLAGCGGAAGNSQEESPSETPTSAQSSEPTSAPETADEEQSPASPAESADSSRAVTLDADLQDSEGYTLTVRASLDDFTASADPASESPGYTRVTYSFVPTFEVTNTSGAHALNFSGFSGTTADGSYFTLQALWPAGGKVCALPFKAAPPGEGACVTTLARFSPLTEISADATVSLGAVGPDGLGDYGIAGFPETAWPTLQPVLEEPTDLLLTYAGDDKDRFAAGDCYRNLETGTAVVASASGECPESAAYIRR